MKQHAQNQVSPKDRAILDLKNARDNLKRAKLKVEADESKLLVRAQAAMKSGDKRSAVMLMKLRKHKTKQVSTVESQLLTVYELTQSIEFESQQVQIFDALKKGKDALKVLHEEINAESVIELMDEIADQNEVEKEINEVFSRGASWNSIDEDELAEDMRALELEVNGEVNGVPDLPPVVVKKQASLGLSELPEVPSFEPVAVPVQDGEDAETRVAVAA
tara:strand:+ start:62 stop:718 length:657 start_codon:yes stop_codon:yes gene_type:complete